MKIIPFILVFTFFIVSNVSACGWFTYEDIEDTRVYYNGYDKIKGVEDGLLLMTRFPTVNEIEKNVYVPESAYWGDTIWLP